eukprot:gene4471-601_t
MQRVLENLESWASENKASVSLDKTEVCVFASRPIAPENRPKLTYMGAVLNYKTECKFLWITLDESLRFTAHVEKIKKKMVDRGGAIKALSGTKWGCSFKMLRGLHLAYSKSCALYGLAACGPLTAKVTLHTLESQQYLAARGCSLVQRTEQAAAQYHERFTRFPDGNKAKEVALRDAPDPPGRSSWRTVARAAVKEAGLDGTARIPVCTHALTPPWAGSGAGSVTFHPRLAEKVTRADPPEKRKAAAEKTLVALPPALVEAWTDGAVPNACRSRAAVARAAADSRARSPGTEMTGKCAAGARCCSYIAELRALRMCLDRLRRCDGDAVPRGVTVRLCTDSLSAVEALIRGPYEQSGLLEQEVWAGLLALSDQSAAHVHVAF